MVSRKSGLEYISGADGFGRVVAECKEFEKDGRELIREISGRIGLFKVLSSGFPASFDRQRPPA